MLKDRIRPLTTPQEVDAFLSENPGCAIFKAGACHKSNEMFRNVEARLGGRGDLPVGLIRVIEARGASDRVADLTGITHESPQLILFKDGKAVFDRDNWDITEDAIAEAIAGHFARV